MSDAFFHFSSIPFAGAILQLGPGAMTGGSSDKGAGGAPSGAATLVLAGSSKSSTPAPAPSAPPAATIIVQAPTPTKPPAPGVLFVRAALVWLLGLRVSGWVSA